MLLHPKLHHPALHLANVVLAIAVQPVPTVLPVPMVTMVSMASLANQASADHLPDQHPNLFRKPPTSAHAKHHQEMQAHQDQKEVMEPQETEVPQALMANPAIKDHVDPLAHPVHQAVPETKAHPVTLVNSLQVNPVHQVLQALQANPALQAQQANPASLAKMVLQALQVPQEMQVLQAVQAKLALPAAPANQERTVHQALATIAHRLVWLQVIKQDQHEQLANNFDCKNTSTFDHKIAKNISSLSVVYPFFFFALLKRSMSEKSHLI